MMYLACDLSGIQRYVLGVKSAGKAQAKRLRARSFLLELFEHAALAIVRDRSGAGHEDVLVSGGGGFLARLPNDADPVTLGAIGSDLQHRLWKEVGGEVHISLGWGATPMEARRHLEYQKRRPGHSILHEDGAWDSDSLSQPPLGDPCGVCGQAPGRWRDRTESVLHCRMCRKARQLGENLTRWRWMRESDRAGEVQALGVDFAVVTSPTPDSFQVGRRIPYNPCIGEPLTFQEIAGESRGDNRLAVMKADIDDMGAKVAEVADSDSSYSQLRSFSRRIHKFFVDDLRANLERSWPFVYTIYAGGDDLLLVGPWDVVLDFAGSLTGEFQTTMSGEFGSLTLSAGIALTPYRVPIRHAVERAEELLEAAKRREGKSSCAALGEVWRWDRHDRVLGDGQRLMEWVTTAKTSRSLLHRLLALTESEDPLRSARWAYQVERNVQYKPFRRWAESVLEYFDRDHERIREARASLRYALLSTRATQRGRR